MKKHFNTIIYLLAIIIFATLYYKFVFKYIERIITLQSEHQFVNHMQMKAMYFDNDLSKYIQGTKSISSRTAIQNKIIEFKNGSISFDELKSFTAPKYMDGVKALEDVIMAQRYVNSQILVQVGECEMSDPGFLLTDTLKKQLRIRFLIKDNTSLIYVISPIVDNSDILGYDIIYFNHTPTEQKMLAPNIKFSLQYNLQDTNRNFRNNEVVYTSDKAMCFIKSEFANVNFQFTTSKAILLKELNNFYTTQMFVIGLLIICIVLITYIIHRRAMLVSIKKSEYMEMLVTEKTVELNNTIEELNKVNEKLHSVNQIVSNERKQFLSILDCIPELIYVSDFNTHKILFTNKKFKELIGRDVIGEVCYQALHDEPEACHFCTNEKIKNTNNPHFWDSFNPVMDKHFYIMDRKIRWTDNKEVRFSMAVDISKQKQAEQIIAEDALKQKELNVTKDLFISILGHDLKNPFNSLLGFSELLLRNIDKYDMDTIRKYVGYINDASEHTFKLLSNLMEWSISQRDKVSFNPQIENLYTLIYETIALVNPMAEIKHIKIILDLPQKIVAEVDVEMIKTIIRNLLSNAIKFTHENGEVRVLVKKVNETVQIKITDNGLGMDSQTMESLFNIGESKSQKGTNDEQGTGFGLLLIKALVDIHKGTITVNPHCSSNTPKMLKFS